MNELTIKQKILYVWKAGGPRDPDKPDELKSWIESYFPNQKYKSETIARRARELRESSFAIHSPLTINNGV